MQKAACVLTAACFISSGWLLVRGASSSAWKTQGKVFRSLQLALSFHHDSQLFLRVEQKLIHISNVGRDADCHILGENLHI